MPQDELSMPPDGVTSSRTKGWRSWWSIAGVAAIAAVVAALAAVVSASKDGQTIVFLPTDTPSSAAQTVSASGCWPSLADGYAAWGPARPTFSANDSPNYPSLNSTTDNPSVGDERLFVAIKEADNKDQGGFHSRIEAKPDTEYLIRVYIHNAAEEDSLIAEDTRLTIALPTCQGHSIAIQAFVESSNALPERIWDGVALWAREDFNLAYVSDSAILYSNAHPDPGIYLKGETGIVSGKGVLLGYESMDGNVRPGYKNAIYVTLKVRAQFAER